MLSYKTIVLVAFALLQNTSINAFTIPKNMNTISFGGLQTQLYSESQGAFSGPSPETFREAEVLGLRLMQEGQHEEALKGKIPTRTAVSKGFDVIKFFSFSSYTLLTPALCTTLHFLYKKSFGIAVFQNGLKLPGSRTDIIRTRMISGPSPVGGASGGTEGKVVQTLDEFEFQAAHYNIACACASLDKISESCASLEQAFKYGFDNYATVRADPDLSSVHGTTEFDILMERFDSKKGFFGLFK